MTGNDYPKSAKHSAANAEQSSSAKVAQIPWRLRAGTLAPPPPIQLEMPKSPSKTVVFDWNSKIVPIWGCSDDRLSKNGTMEKPPEIFHCLAKTLPVMLCGEAKK
jgi:hypothetical protein